MGKFIIEGGLQLKGEITPQGAKNEALQIISATLLSAEKIIINKIPDIRDVNKLIQLLKDMGVKVEQLGAESYSFQADQVNLAYMKTEEFKEQASSLRGSVMIMGPLLSRFGEAYLPQPGGHQNHGSR